MEDTQLKDLSPLEILLLVFVEFGLSTPYDLLSKAGLGVGLTSPVLKRLEAAGMLKSVPGPRRRLRYSLTTKGDSVLRESLYAGPERYWQHGQTDVFESLPRGIILSWLHSGADEAHQGVARASRNLLVLAKRREREAEEMRESMSRLEAGTLTRDPSIAKGQLIGTAYQWIKAESDAVLYRLQAEAIGGIHKLLTDLPPSLRAEPPESPVG